MLLVERDEPLEQLALLLAGCVEGRGATGIISGGVGFGKTALLEAVAERAAAQGHIILSAVGARSDGDFPYAVLDQLLQCAEQAEAGTDLRTLLEQAMAPGTGDPAPSIAHILQASYRMLAELSRRRPVVICIDDVQYSDPQSLRCLLYLIRRCRRLPVAILLTDGPPGATESETLLAELACRPGIMHIRLAALTQEGVAQLITAKFGKSMAGRRTRQFIQATGGNHLLVQALLNDHTAQGTCDDDQRLVPGDVFRDAALACVHRSGPDALRVARGIAVLNGAGSAALLGQLVERGDRVVHPAVKILTDSRLLAGGQEGSRFRHSVIRAAVLDEIPAEERARLHRRAGWLLREDGASALVVASYLFASGPVKDDATARLLMEAAEQALADDQVDLATRCLRFAEACCTDEQQAHVIRMTLAQIMRRDRPEASTHILQNLVGPAMAGELPGATSLKVAHGLLMRGQVDEASEILKRLGGAEKNTDQQLAFELDIARLWLASTYPGAAKRFEESLGRPSGQHPMPTGPSAPSRLSANRALWTVLALGADESVVAEAERVLQSVPIGDRTIESLLSALMTLVYADRLKTAASWCDVFLAKAADRQAPMWNAHLQSTRALIALRQGALGEAVQRAEAALKLMPEDAWGVGIGMPLAVLIEARTAMGHHEIGTELANRPVPEMLFQTRFGLHYLYARGRHHLAKGYDDVALADFLACGEKVRAWDLDSPVLAPWRIGAAEVWLRHGKRERASEIADEHLALVSRGQRRTHGVALRTIAATRAPSQQLEPLGKSLEILLPTGDRYEAALTLADLSRAYQHHGRERRARLLGRQAWHMARECGAEELQAALMPKPTSADQVEVEGSPSADDKATNLLSEAEMRVTSLAAQGYTNREIADKLFITVSTVEQHLTRVYRKLNIRHRQELPTSFAS